MIKKFRYAFYGLRLATKQSSFVIQLCTAAIAIFCGIILSITAQEWVWIVFSIISVLTLEIINTAIEESCNIFSHGWLLDEIKIIKDLTAAAVLMASIGSVIIGLIIFIPYFITYIS